MADHLLKSEPSEMPPVRFSPFESSDDEMEMGSIIALHKAPVPNAAQRYADQTNPVQDVTGKTGCKILGIVRSSGRLQINPKVQVRCAAAPTRNKGNGVVKSVICNAVVKGEDEQVTYKHTRLLKTLGIPPVPKSWLEVTAQPTSETRIRAIENDLMHISIPQHLTLGQIPCVDVRLCYGALGYTFLDHVIGQIEKGLDDFNPSVFKIGITAQVEFRARKYVEGHFDSFRLLAALRTSDSCRDLEKLLIDRYKGKTGCRNEKPGGEGNMRSGPPFFVYSVFALASKPCRIGG